MITLFLLIGSLMLAGSVFAIFLKVLLWALSFIFGVIAFMFGFFLLGFLGIALFVSIDVLIAMGIKKLLLV